MATKKRSKPQSSSTRKTAAKKSKPAGAKKAASKRLQAAAKSKKPKKGAERPAWLKRRDALTLKIFDMAYEANQRGEFHRIQ